MNQTLSNETPISSTKINVRQLFWLFAGLTLVGLGAGIYSQIGGHQHLFGNTREMSWGLLISTYAWFAIISTGLCILAFFSHAFGGNQMAPLGNRMVYLSLVAILGGFMVIGLEIENPWRMPLGVLFHPNLTSNIWWMGTLYGLAVGIITVELFLIVSGRFRLALFIGAAGALAEMLANSNLGSVFASLHSRPFWYGSQLPVFFLASAILSGAAAIVLATQVSCLLRKRNMEKETFMALQTGGKIMMLMTFMVLLATGWKFANAYCSTGEMILAADSMVRGPLSTQFWLFEVTIGLLLPMLILMLSRLESLQALSGAALFVLVGQFFSRFNLVVAGQIVPVNHGAVGVPDYLQYSPSPAEYLVVIAGIGVVGLGFCIGELYFSKLFFEGEHKESTVLSGRRESGAPVAASGR